MHAPTLFINGVSIRIRHRHLYDIYKTYYVEFEKYFFIFDMILTIKIRNKYYIIIIFCILDIR